MWKKRSYWLACYLLNDMFCRIAKNTTSWIIIHSLRSTEPKCYCDISFSFCEPSLWLLQCTSGPQVTQPFLGESCVFDLGSIGCGEVRARREWRLCLSSLRLGVWPLGSQRSVEISVFAWPAWPCLFLTIIQLSVEQHLSSCLCVASLFMVLKTMEEKTC